MSAKDFMANLAKRTDKRRTKKESRAKKKCPLKFGDIFVSTYKLKDRKAIRGVKVEVDGRTKKTDRMGIAEFLDKDPGEYDWKVDWAGTKYANDHHNANEGKVGVAGGSIATRASGTEPAGALKVEVRHMDENGGEGALVSTDDIVKITVNRQQAPASNQHTFGSLAEGNYFAEAKFKKNRFVKDRGVSESVDVIAKKTAEVVILVRPMTWLEVKVIEADGGAPVKNVQIRASFESDDSISKKTASTGVMRHEMIRDGGKYEAESFVTPGTDVYVAEEFT